MVTGGGGGRRATLDGVQRLLSTCRWDADLVCNELIRYVPERLAQTGGVLVVDEPRFLKKGSKSVGVAYCSVNSRFKWVVVYCSLFASCPCLVMTFPGFFFGNYLLTCSHGFEEGNEVHLPGPDRGS